ncbi:MAG: hypothetical protein RL701_5199 [Pseudomonadota bacterium]
MAAYMRESILPGPVSFLESDAAQSGQALQVAEALLAGFDTHYERFRQLSAQSRDNYERSDWSSARKDSIARIESYDLCVEATTRELAERFGALENESDTLWRMIKRAYVALLADHRQPECAETYYNSVACRLLARRYYRNEYIFFRPAISTDYLDESAPVYRCDTPKRETLRDTIRSLLSTLPVNGRFHALERDVGFILRAVEEHFGRDCVLHDNFQLHTLSSLFYRNRAAYLVGRAINGEHTWPFVLPILKNRVGDLFIDSVLFDHKSIGRLFSLARAYFMVDMEVPAAYAAFLKTLLPSKSASEIYTMLGLQKQGKTLFYREMQHHLAHSTDTFVLAPGARGMVMSVFTLPSFPYVFKVIRDWFDPPKAGDRRHVREKYRMVKHHDRVGRMADSLEYSNVGLPKHRFDPSVLAELERVAPSMVECDGDTVVIRHVYIERRMTPLDVYLRQANDVERREAIAEFGDTLKDLASANIFPGDLLLKNFGVTRYGKVASYDYDETCYLTDVNFRALPVPSSYEEEISGEPWFSVGAHDVFPEEFLTFLFPNDSSRALFVELHPDLARPSFWIDAQERVKDGRERSVYPYPRELRFHKRYGGFDSPTEELSGLPE